MLSKKLEMNIKSKNRVQKHGEVFTPEKIAEKILDLNVFDAFINNLTITFLEPAVGEGVFLVEILNRKLKSIRREYGEKLVTFENYSLLALTTLYGVELLEDNAQKCVMNLYQCFYEHYLQVAIINNSKVKKNVLESAKVIISNNIVQGDMLKKITSDGCPIVFSEWKPTNLNKNVKNIKIQRTEYYLEDIINGVSRTDGLVNKEKFKEEQLDFGLLFDEEDTVNSNDKVKSFKYVVVKITDLYKEEMEEDYGQALD